jgi:hypothetical protein
MIIVVGYSFNDSHINGLLGQALRASNRKLLVVDNKDEYIGFILSKLQLENGYRSQIEYMKMTAKNFLESELTKENMEALIPDDDAVF